MRLSTFKNPAITTFSQLSDALSSNNKYQIITIWKLQFLLILNVQILGNYKISRFTIIASQYSVEYKKHTEFVYQHYVPANVTVFIPVHTCIVYMYMCTNNTVCVVLNSCYRNTSTSIKEYWYWCVHRTHTIYKFVHTQCTDSVIFCRNLYLTYSTYFWYRSTPNLLFEEDSNQPTSSSGTL